MALNVLKGASMPVPMNNMGASLIYDSTNRNFLDLYTNTDIKTALDKCTPINYLVGKVVDAVCQGEFTIVKKKDNTIADYGVNVDFLNLLKNPNPIQNQDQFIGQIIYDIIPYGFVVCLKNKGLSEGEYSGMWALPSELTLVKWKDKYNYKALYSSGIMELVEEVTFDGERLNKDDLFIITYKGHFRKSSVIPQSPLASAKQAVNNLIINYEGRGKLMDSPSFVISDGGGGNSPNALGMKDDDKKDIVRKLEDSYGISGKKSKYIVNRSSLKVDVISFPMSSMNFDGMEKMDVMTLAEVIGVPPELLGIYGNANVSERESAEKSFYRRTIMPTIQNIFQQMSIGVGMGSEFIYYASYDHVEAMQADKKLESEVRRNDIVSVKTAIRSNLMTYGAGMKILEQECPDNLNDKYYFQLPADIKEGFDSQTNNTNATNGN